MDPLPRPSIDTGLGLERMASVLQDVASNFETDLLRPIIAATENAAQKRFGQNDAIDVAMKVIADHSRAAAFLIGDGILPSNEGRGYVLRRIMRRAIRYGRNIGLTRPFLHETAGVVFDIMKTSYPELAEAHAFITNVIKNEEVRFSETLDYGLRLLNDTLGDLRARGETQVPGEVIFKLYDTYGFPVDIVADVVRDEQLALDMQGFERAMEGQRAQSRSVATFASLGEAYKNLSARGVRPVFVGYDRLAEEAEVLLLVANDREVASAGAGEAVEIVTDRTPFYGAAGGQVGDTGRIVAAAEGGELEIAVEDTVKDPTGLIIHKGQVLSGRLQGGDHVRLEVDGDKRAATARNHTATHILHAVLREVLGAHVKQAGSLVAPDRLRFDFTHFAQVDATTLDRIETLVNAQIRDNVPTHTEEMDIDAAFKAGATALFEEKYGDRVRVVSMSDFSKELCGGTHTARTGDVGFFKILAESSVASGVRRIEALTGEAAVAHAQRTENQLRQAANLLKDKPEFVADRLARLLAEHREQEKTITKLKAAAATGSLEDIEQEVRTVNGIKVLAKRVAVDNPAALRDLADRFKDKLGSGIVVLGSATESKALLIAGVTKDLVGTYHAGHIVKAVAAVVGGGGGGRPDMAQAGGPDAAKIEEALAQVYEIVAAR
jgi:alanyl-tRNA synthetase